MVAENIIGKAEDKVNALTDWGNSLKMGQNTRAPSVSKKKKIKPVSTTEKQSMAYVTVKNIENETSHLEADWTLFVLKELIDNAWDWINDEYPAVAKAVRKIGVRIWLTHEGEENSIRFVHIAVRNSNVDNVTVFEDLNKTFHFNLWHSTKRNQHRMTCGSLGDALKRSLGMGYASWTRDYDASETFEDKQWEQPVIVRCNSKEFRAFIKVNSARQERWTEIIQEHKPSRDIGTDTEVEITLPILNSLDEDSFWIRRLQNYYDKARIGKSTRTEFSIEVEEQKLEVH